MQLKDTLLERERGAWRLLEM